MQVSAVDVTGRPTKHVQGAVDDGHGLQVTERKQLGRKETWQQRLKKNSHPPEARRCLQSSTHKFFRRANENTQNVVGFL